MTVSGVVLGAGRGERLGRPENKVWTPVAGCALIDHALRGLWMTGVVDELVVVIRPSELVDFEFRSATERVPVRVVAGGPRRQDSARAGVEAASGTYVLVHDGARPCVNGAVVAAVLDAARRHGAAVPVLPVADTLRYADDSGFLKVDGPVRRGLVHVQTPQGFDRALLLKAYGDAEARGATLPDDAAALLSGGHPVAAVPGDPAMFKVTGPDDLRLMERLFGAP